MPARWAATSPTARRSATSAPVLIALDARSCCAAARERTMPLPDFYLDYMKNRLEPGEFVQAIVMPLPAPPPGARVEDQQALRLRHLGAVRRASRSSSTATSVRPRGWPSAAWPASSSARRRPRRRWSASPGREADGARAQAALAEDFKPLTDMRASAAYRAQVAPTCCSASGSRRARKIRCRPDATSVFAAMTHEEAEMNKPIADPPCSPAPRRRSASACRTSRRTCTWPAKPPTSTTCPNSPARCTRARPVAGGARPLQGIDSTACAPCPAWLRC
jgi:hypothetical protein